MGRGIAHLVVFVGLGILLLSGASGGDTPQPLSRPSIILIGIDALGWDFLAKAETPHLDRLVREGVSAERLIPVFPTKTFPNFYSMATGLYPEHHGIVANNMFDPKMDERFSLSDRRAVRDGRWWGGEPIWLTAAKAGLVAAAYFWPGTEAPIQNVRPRYWKDFHASTPDRARVDQVLEALDYPPTRRPSLITHYFNTIDDAAHPYELSSPQVTRAIRAVDRAIGRLLTGLEERGLRDRVNIVVVSDHGMTDTSRERTIFLDDYIDLATVDVVDWDPVMALRPLDESEEEIYTALAGAHPHLQVYRKAEIPKRFHYRAHRRIQPILGIADEGWMITTRRRFERLGKQSRGASHGYDNHLPSMGATFIAAGPAFKRGLVVPPFESIHIYELLCALLGLEPAPNDGNLDKVRGMLREAHGAANPP